jgi:hypothetical protein
MDPIERFTVHTIVTEHNWKPYRRQVSGFDKTHLYLECSESYARWIAREMSATRLQRSWTYTGRNPDYEPCDSCGSTGRWCAGTENGQPIRPGVCFRCSGKGYQSRDDGKRNWGYDVNRKIYI